MDRAQRAWLGGEGATMEHPRAAGPGAKSADTICPGMFAMEEAVRAQRVWLVCWAA
jgi:hypothetical protein